MSNAITAMTNDVNVGIDEVVAIFVAKHEDALHAKKDALQQAIRRMKAELDGLTKAIVNSVDKTEFEITIAQLGLFFKVDDVSVIWKAQYSEKVGVKINVGMWDKSNERSYASHTKTIMRPLNQIDIDEHQRLNTELEQANAELLVVLGQIKDVSRKERQVRGRIAELKLEQAGKTDLLSNPDLQKLIG